jgi:hypothetical protein
MSTLELVTYGFVINDGMTWHLFIMPWAKTKLHNWVYGVAQVRWEIHRNKLLRSISEK